MARALKRPNLSRPKLPSLPRLPDPNEPDVFEEMTLLEHMEELRDRIVRTSIAIGIAFVAGWFLSEPLLGRIRDTVQIDTEAGGFDTINPADPLTNSMKVALYIAIAIALPIIVYQIIGFLAPGLTRREKRAVYMSLPFVSGLFFGGVAFAFFLAAPRALDFLANFRPELYDQSPTAEGTISFYLTLMLGLGVAFQLPIVMLLLAILNVASPHQMSKYRKYAAVVILIVAAIITPTVDPFNMAFIAVPIYLLYEVGILLGRIFVRRKAKTRGAAS